MTIRILEDWLRSKEIQSKIWWNVSLITVSLLCSERTVGELENCATDVPVRQSAPEIRFVFAHISVEWTSTC